MVDSATAALIGAAVGAGASIVSGVLVSLATRSGSHRQILYEKRLALYERLFEETRRLFAAEYELPVFRYEEFDTHARLYLPLSVGIEFQGTERTARGVEELLRELRPIPVLLYSKDQIHRLALANLAIADTAYGLSQSIRKDSQSVPAIRFFRSALKFLNFKRLQRMAMYGSFDRPPDRPDRD